MTDKEILKALLEGKKLTSKEWDKGEYIYLNNSGDLVDEKGDKIFFTMETSYSFVFDGDSLQEYIQYGDFAQAMNHIVNGGKTIIKGRYGFHYLDDKGNVCGLQRWI